MEKGDKYEKRNGFPEWAQDSHSQVSLRDL